ncbi:MAG: MFS transporter [Candidatus Nanopelagicales bacterium]
MRAGEELVEDCSATATPYEPPHAPAHVRRAATVPASPSPASGGSAAATAAPTLDDTDATTGEPGADDTAAPASAPATTGGGTTSGPRDPATTEPTSDPAEHPAPSEGLFGPTNRAFTVGIVTVMTMFAFEGIGVATAMPVVARALDGLGSYAWAFNGYVVASLVAMVAAGEWCDRSGPRPALLVGVSLFGAGAVVSGLAWAMPVLVAGRLVQGLGGGMAIVAVYVVIGRQYADDIRPKAFALLAAAWVLPAIVGPVIAGFLTDHVSWRAVFLLVPVLVAPPMLVLAPRLARLGGALGEAQPRRGRLRLAVVAAAGLALLQEAGTRLGVVGLLLAVVGAALVVPSLDRLLPKGALRFARGLPTVVMMRGLLAGTFFAGEAFVPLALQTIRGVPTAQAGLILTVGAVGWAVGSQAQGRLYGRVPRAALVQAGAVLSAVCMLTMPFAMLGEVPWWTAGISWFLGASGMGLCFGAIATLTLELSEPQDQGVNSAALQVCDSVGSVLFIGIAGAIYAAAVAAGAVTGWTFAEIWLVMGAVAAIGAVLARRIGRPTLA